jgi:hypothetical protein
MKKTKNCIVADCIPTPSSCILWDGGDIDALGICNGSPINNVILEIVDKLEELAGEDISTFDIDALIHICEGTKAPLEINLRNILTLLRDNQICLKDYIDTLEETIRQLGNTQDVDVNLKCFLTTDNLGNDLNVTRKELDQLVINELCSQKDKLSNLEGRVSDLENADVPETGPLGEATFGTCLNPSPKAASLQVIKTAEELCTLRGATGTATDIASALAKTPETLRTEFGLIPNWELNPDNLAESYGNALIVIGQLLARVKHIEDTCCASTCDDVKLGFTALMNEDNTGMLIRFTNGAGTNIPAGFTDKGSKGTVTDKNGDTIDFTLQISNNSETEVILTGLDLTGDLEIDITAILGSDGLVCQKCVSRKVKLSSSNCCVITNSGSADLTIVYQTTTN